MGRKYNYEQRRHIIKTAVALFLEKGYDKVTTRMIAQACGMQRALLHHYFNKKETILLDVTMDIIRKINDHGRLTLSPGQMAIMDVNMFFLIFYGMMSIDPRYKNIFNAIYHNARILNMLLRSIINDKEVLGSSTFTEQKKFAIFVVNGSMAQMILFSESDGFPMTDQELINFMMRGYYFYLGVSEDEARQMIDLASKIVTKPYVRKFIRYYETKTGLRKFPVKPVEVPA
ncbi:MAG: TetR/AcrR family transcriptional regulator [Treponema sp.]|jgi:AcrR family transcriptional regulator|nr:TetR/AcrR family transcriptional regulator [Treponema sp.]